MNIARIKAYINGSLNEANDFRVENPISEINNVHVLHDFLDEFRIIVPRLNMYQTELVVLSGQENTCVEYKDCITKSRKYIRDLRIRKRELESDSGMEKFNRKLVISVRKAEGLAALAYETISQYVANTSAYANYSSVELEKVITEVRTAIKEFRLAHIELSALLGNQYDDARVKFQGDVICEANQLLSSLKNLTSAKRAP